MSDQIKPFDWDDVERWRERLPQMLAKAEAVQTADGDIVAGVFYAFGETARMALEARQEAARARGEVERWKRLAGLVEVYEAVLDQVWESLKDGGGGWTYPAQVAGAVKAKAAETRRERSD